MTAAPIATHATCLHCGLPVGPGGPGDFCCTDCAAVYGLLHTEHLERYYALQGRRGVPVADVNAARRDAKWLEAIEARVRDAGGPTRVTLDVQGLHCVGCVWLVEELFRRTSGGEHAEVNPALVRCGELTQGDVLLVEHGDLVPDPDACQLAHDDWRNDCDAHRSDIGLVQPFMILIGPAAYFGFVAIATVAYLGIVEVAKRAPVRHGTLARPARKRLATSLSLSSEAR